MCTFSKWKATIRCKQKHRANLHYSKVVFPSWEWRRGRDRTVPTGLDGNGYAGAFSCSIWDGQDWQLRDGNPPKLCLSPKLFVSCGVR